MEHCGNYIDQGNCCIGNKDFQCVFLSQISNELARVRCQASAFKDRQVSAGRLEERGEQNQTM